MKEVLVELFGDLVTEEKMLMFDEALGKKFVLKSDFDVKSEEVVSLAAEKLVLDSEISKMAIDFEMCKSGACKLAKELHEMKVDAVIMEVLRTSGARNFVAVKALLNLGEIEIGFDEQELRSKVVSEVERLRLDVGSEFLFMSADLASGMLHGFSPAESSEIARDDRGGFGFRLAIAKRDDDYVSMVKIKQDAAKQGVYLP